MAKKRIGIVGLGEIAAKVYLPLLSQHDEVEIVGIMSATAEKVEQIGRRYRLPGGTTRLKDLLARELDAVFIHTPTETHYRIAKECLLQGVPVYVDKPLSYEWAEVKELAALAERKGLLLGVGFNRRFAPLYAEAKAWMEQQGGFEWCSVQKHRTHQQTYSAKLTLYDDLIHILDLLLWLGGSEYQLSTHIQKNDIAGKLLSATGALSFEPAVGVYSMVRQAGFDLEKVEMHGHGRSAEVVNMETGTFYEKGAPPRLQSFGGWDTILYRRGFTGSVEHFLHCLSVPQQCTIRADLVLESHTLVERLLKQ